MSTPPLPAVPSFRRPVARTGWWFVLAGWLCQVPAAAGTMYVSDIFFVLSLLGVACVGVGAYLLRGRATAGVIFVALFGGLIMVVGVITGAEGLAKNLWGKTATCQVQEVQRRVTTETERDSDGRPIGTRTVVFYPHTLACPDRTYTVNGSGPHPVGSAVEVRYDPRGSEPPEFTDQASSGGLSFSAAALVLGGLIEILLPVVAWRRGRHSPAAPPPPAQYGPTQHGSTPYGSAPYGSGPYGSPRPAPPGPIPPPHAAYPPGQTGPAGPAEPVPIESPHFEQAVRDSMGPSMSPGERLALPFVVRLLRRRMGAKEAPPNPLAGRYQPPQPPPPQGPPVSRRPPPPQPGPPPDVPYERRPDDPPPDQRR